ncbi:MAG: hypothetical protein ACT4ON_12675 [Bacteroidota bacterium]
MKKVSLKLNRRSVPDKIEFAGIIVQQMTNNPYFSSPNPSLSSITFAADTLETAYKKAQVGNTKDTEDMYAKEKVLDRLLTAEGNYVENIANLTPETAEVVILSAGMEVKSQGSINIPVLSASKGTVPFSVKLRRKSEGPRVAYTWQYSPDPFEEDTWQDAGDSTVATFEISTPLEQAKRYWFRVAVIRGTVQEDFSDPVTFVIS